MSSTSLVAFNDLAFTYPRSQTALFSGLSVHFQKGFTGIVGANGVGKSTLLKLATGSLQPGAGTVRTCSTQAYCEQRTDTAPRALDTFLNDWSQTAIHLRATLDIDDQALAAWSTLSHGERKRCQIAVALWSEPDLLALDEPTNHIDAQCRAQLIQCLHNFHGIALLVSHDRALLDEFCTQCLWLEGGKTQVYSGNFTQTSAQRAQSRQTGLHQQQSARREHRALTKEMHKRRAHAATSQRDRSKRGLSRQDHDAKEKINRAKVTDSKDGQALRQLAGRASRAANAATDARVDKIYQTGIWLPGSLSRRKTLFTLEAGSVALGDTRKLSHPRLDMPAAERIAITGANGSGKSRLLAQILKQLNVPSEQLIYMPQEITAEVAKDTLDQARQLPAEPLGHLMNIVSRLGSRPQPLLQSAMPSPGEIRKLILALGMVRLPHLIIMDEPTNHLDLPAIEALEEALTGCPCGLMLVSHDQRFLATLGTTHWHITVDEHQQSHLSVEQGTGGLSQAP